VKVKVAVIDGDSPDRRVLREAAGLINAGEVIVCPTDTGYALAADALDTAAVTKVFTLKGRDFAKPVHVAVGSLMEAGKYAVLNRDAERLARRFLPGALTLVLPRREVVPALLVGGRATVGIRVPDNRAMLALAALTGVPLTATSANQSGQPAPYDSREVAAQLLKMPEGVAMVLDQGRLPVRGLSTIVDLSVALPRLLRPGLISWEEIQAVLREE